MQSSKHNENQRPVGHPLVSVLPGASLSPETAEVIYASKNQMWFRVRPTDEERALMGNLANRCRPIGTKENNVVEIYKVIGGNLRKRRTARGISHQRLAEMLGLKDDSSISRMERGLQTIAVHQLLALANIFECDIKDFLENEERP